MTPALAAFVGRELAMPVSPEIAAMATSLATDLGGRAVLFYGSALRTGDLDGVLDFYVLTDGARGSLLRRAGMRWLWPDVSFHEMAIEGVTMRAKVATMPLATFEAAARGSFVDTTIWTRFVQPSALVWNADGEAQARVAAAVAQAAITAARFAAVLGPDMGRPGDYWRALFRQTYRAELRVEAPGRERQILAYDPARYDALLGAAWKAGGIDFALDGDRLCPRLNADRFRSVERAWRVRVRSGKALNIARLLKAAFTFDGAARYGLWKIQRHTGISVPLTPWRERHPVLAAPAVMWRVLRAQASDRGVSFTALVLAGSRGGTDPLAGHAGVSDKAMIEIDGVTMLARVVAALRLAGAERIVAVVSSDVVRDETQALGVEPLDAAAGPSASAAKGFALLGAPLLVTTADHALLRAEWVTRFLNDVPDDADVAVLLARRDVVERAVPETKRTWLRFADGAWSGCNLFWLATPRAGAAIDLWRRVESDRKRPWRIVGRLGPRLLWRYLTGRLTLAAGLARVGELAGVRARMVASPFGLAAVDVDKPADLDLVRGLLTRSPD